jgi:hypothetical protein
MKSTNWKTWLELVGIAAIVTSLVFVGAQLRLDRQIMTVSTFGSVTESTNGLSELVQNNGELWVRGLDGKELTDSENAVFMSMVRAVDIHYLNYFIRWAAAGSELRTPEDLAQIYATQIYMYPGLRRAIEMEVPVFQLRNTAFGTAAQSSNIVRSQALQHLKRLDELAPDIPATKTYVIW